MTTVFIAGGFDLLHKGHLYILSEARKLGDRLVVATNHDAYFARKGPGRPVDALAKRMENLFATGLVDEVHAIEDSPLGLIMRLRPDIIAVGDDYTPDRVVGATECKAWNGRVIIIPRIPGFSTTKEVANAKRRHKRYMASMGLPEDFDYNTDIHPNQR
jgi:rfaE bifunctional protein nucleotidyltransferase chain/domain